MQLWSIHWTSEEAEGAVAQALKAEAMTDSEDPAMDLETPGGRPESGRRAEPWRAKMRSW